MVCVSPGSTKLFISSVASNWFHTSPKDRTLSTFRSKWNDGKWIPLFRIDMHWNPFQTVSNNGSTPTFYVYSIWRTCSSYVLVVLFGFLSAYKLQLQLSALLLTAIIPTICHVCHTLAWHRCIDKQMLFYEERTWRFLKHCRRKKSLFCDSLSFMCHRFYWLL